MEDQLSTMDRKKKSVKRNKTCRCGHDRDHFWVSPQARYSMYGFIMGVFMGLSGTLPKSVCFKCRKCGQIIEERYDKATLRAYREH